jgi:hypothetical protein
LASASFIRLRQPIAKLRIIEDIARTIRLNLERCCSTCFSVITSSISRVCSSGINWSSLWISSK